MSDKDEDDFMTPEEIQAKANSAKIAGFIANIGWQFIVFITVIYATYYNNPLADIILTGYGWLLGLSCAMFFLLVIKPLEKVAVSAAMNSSSLRMRTPTAMVLRGINTIFSIVEITLLVSYNWPVLAGLWAATEALQYATVFKLKMAAELKLEAELGLNVEQMVDAQFKNNPAFVKDFQEDMKQYREDMQKIDKLIIDLDTKGDKYEEDLDALIVDREKLIIALETRITRAALETMRDNEKK